MKYIILVWLIFSFNQLFALDLRWEKESFLIDNSKDKALAAYNKKDFGTAENLFDLIADRSANRQNIASAKLGIAECLVRSGTYGAIKGAVAMYKELIENYPKEVPFLEILNQEYFLARNFFQGRKRFRIFPLDNRALDLYDHIILKAPQYKLASEALFQKGEIYRSQNDLQLALLTYDKFLTQYPKHPKAKDARSHLIVTLVTLAQDHDGDGKLIRRANIELEKFFKLYPDDKRVDTLKKMQVTTRELEGDRLLKLAKFYRNKYHYRPEASKRYLNDVITKYEGTTAYKEAVILKDKWK